MFEAGDKVRIRKGAKAMFKSIGVWKSGVYDPYLGNYEANLRVDRHPSSELRKDGTLLDVVVMNDRGTWFVSSDLLALDMPEKMVTIKGVEYSEGTAQKAMEAYVKGQG